MQAIDFVVLWVDGTDPAWQAERRNYRLDQGMDASEIRYRDWGTLRHLLRSIERFAPWHRRIHLITWGHLPEWLNTDHPKLHIVRHTDYIPREWLPTFNSNVLELNLWRIEALAEHFILLNDDTFLTRPTQPEDFFRKGQPCDMARLSVVRPSSVGPIILNNLERINTLHSRKALNRHIGKWLAPCYGVGNLLKTISLLPWSFFPAFYDSHQMQPYRKADFKRAWELWGEDLKRVCTHRFRSTEDLSHWLVRYDVLCRGDFAPRSMQDCSLVTLTDKSIGDIALQITQQQQRLLCLNDSEQIADFEAVKTRLVAAFETLLPTPSSYEK